MKASAHAQRAVNFSQLSNMYGSSVWYKFILLKFPSFAVEQETEPANHYF